MDKEILKWTMIVEGKTSKLQLESLPYSRNELAPALSKETIDYHYGTLAKAYVTRYNNNEGDKDFNYSGAILHNILFPQYQPPKNNNTPTEKSQELIDNNFKSFDKFKEEFFKTAMGIQGSGWIYLDKSGKIKTIKNHDFSGDPNKIILLIDWWEHAWALDYQADKKKYLENQWKIINWNIVNNRISL